MHCPSLKELPSPPPGKTGWPWTEKSPLLPDVMPDGSPWPKISIITPSYNQGKFLEETIRSVLLQGYPDLEYIIIDGGSSDNSVEIIRKYGKYLDYWVSEPDNGQSHAINKALSRITGNISAWINSDDQYLPNAFKAVATFMWQKSSIVRPIIYSDCYVIDDTGSIVDKFVAKKVVRDDLIAFWKWSYVISQPTVFMATEIFKQNALDERLHYVMDWDLWIRLSEDYQFHYCAIPLAKFRFYTESKTGLSTGRGNPFVGENKRITSAYWGPGYLRYLRFWLSYHRWLGMCWYFDRKEQLKSFISRWFGKKSLQALIRIKRQIMH